MSIKAFIVAGIFFTLIGLVSCRKNGNEPTDPYPAVTAAFGNNINLQQLANYAAQPRPAYIIKDNTVDNPITDTKATLGRVLFYDKALSIDNSVSCASCHKQSFAFSDTALVSKGVAGGVTFRHSMRLVNARFALERRFFWNERAPTLELQTTEPIIDHMEMGFSGQAGRPDINAVLSKLSGINYYRELFRFVYGNEQITVARLQECLAQFIRSIQSFDSKYDEGRRNAPNDGVDFLNFTAQENLGKRLFIERATFNASGQRVAGGLGCASCHAAPEFDITPVSRNNGIIGSAGNPGQIDLNNTRSPSLRDLVKENGSPNGPMMHTGSFTTVRSVLLHYNNILNVNSNLDLRLQIGGTGQKLQMTENEIQAVTAFLQTLAGRSVYTDARWSNPFR